MTCTYLKPQDRTDPSLAGQHSRYDVKNRTTPPLDAQRQVIRSLEALLPRLDAVIVADQAEERDCGVITALVRDGLAEAARRYPQVVFWADSRRRIHEFHGLIIKPNQYEAVGHDNPLPGDEVCLEQIIAALPDAAGRGRRAGLRDARAGRHGRGRRRDHASCPACGVEGPSIRPGPATAPRPGPCWPWPPGQRCPRPPWWATSWPRSPSNSLPRPAPPGPSSFSAAGALAIAARSPGRRPTQLRLKPTRNREHKAPLSGHRPEVGRGEGRAEGKCARGLESFVPFSKTAGPAWPALFTRAKKSHRGHRGHREKRRPRP